jgi:8-oxo-dGTP pyrophosphatase MutT (NUDIX family)
MSHSSPTLQRIRPLAICVFHHCGRILVTEVPDPIEQRCGFRPLGGGIEFGETSAATVVREIREELDCEVVDLQLLGTLENIFTYLDAPHHEIVQIYDGAFADRSLYDRSFLEGRESNSAPFRAYWHGRARFNEVTPLYPPGLQELLVARGLLE